MRRDLVPTIESTVLAINSHGSSFVRYELPNIKYLLFCYDIRNLSVTLQIFILQIRLKKFLKIEEAVFQAIFVFKDILCSKITLQIFILQIRLKKVLQIEEAVFQAIFVFKDIYSLGRHRQSKLA